MEREFSQDYHSTEQPHFDEEWTLLTARPVVPLEEVKAGKTKSRMFRLISLFAAAIVLGAVSALVVVSLERRHVVEPIAVQAEEQQPTPTPEQEAATPTDMNVPEANTATEEAPTTAPKTVAIVRAKTKAAEREVEDKTVAQHRDKDVDVDVDSSDQSRPVLFDEYRARWEERRARRIRRQERRENGGRRGRDLRRIDEIFEGARP